jgi:hypothetical protein
MTNEKPGCLYALLRLFNLQREPVEGRFSPTGLKDSTQSDMRAIPADEVTAPLPDQKAPLPFNLRDDFLSPAEASFFRLLKGVVIDEYLIFPKVSLKDIFFVSRPQENMAYYNKIDRKHVDFLLCDAHTLKPAVGIELDDSSHQRPERVERDEWVGKVFEQAGLPLRRIQVRRAYSQQELEELVRGAAPAAAPIPQTEPWDSNDSPPYCPKCGERMLLRTAQRGAKAGSQFYGCPNYPKCREIIAA